MALDLYSPCPCGSGKKFKWCCQPIHGQIEKAFRLDADGQHEAALRTVDEVTDAHPSNPEAWGRKAQLLFQNNRLDEAESTLQKALEINPSYPFGYLLRGLFRQHEGELAGALLLFRKAAELYDPEAKDILAEVYSLIADTELRLNRPVASRAALEISLHLQANPDLSREMDELFGAKSHLPEAARRQYTLATPAADASADWRAAWKRALTGATTGKLSDAARAFEQLTKEKPDDPAAHYNLGLMRAWLGDNRAALEALEQYVRLEPDESRAASAWALAEVLRFGQGLEDQADYVEHSVLFHIKDPHRFFQLLQDWQREHRLAAVQVRQEEGVVSGVILDSGGLVTAGAANPYPKLGAYLIIVHDLLRLWSTNAETLDRTGQDLQQRAGPALSDARRLRGPAHFGDVYAEAVIFPTQVSEEEAQKLLREHIQRYFEETWIHRPLRSLDNVPPIDAAGHPVLRKRLLGVMQFLQQCATAGPPPYDFNRLRRKLGLLPAGTAAVGAGAAPAPIEIEALSAADLAGLQPESLTDEQVEQAYRAAQKLDAGELAGRFARAMISRPPHPDRPDRFPWYSYLVQTALAQGNMQTALQYVDEGEKADCEQNEGQRRNDYELRRGQVLAKSGDAEAARDVFERLIARAPNEVKYCGTAAESMLSVKQGTAALRFAEQGLAKARQNNDRESEQYFLELAGAAKKQGGA
jgi:tetratricopeptide (TPR) repeat protein